MIEGFFDILVISSSFLVIYYKINRIHINIFIFWNFNQSLAERLTLACL